MDGGVRRRIFPQDLDKTMTNGTKLYIDYDYKTFKGNQKFISER